MAPLIFLDAYPLVAFLVEEPAAEEVAGLLRDNASRVLSLNAAEAFDVACRVHALPEADVEEAFETLVATRSLAVLPVGREEAWRAARLRIAHYERRQRALSLADCFLLAAAGPGDSVATSDPAVAEVARIEDIGLVPLPDSSGVRP